MIFCGIIALLLYLLVKNHSSDAERAEFGHTIKTSVDKLDSAVHELTIDNRVKERMLTEQSEKSTGTDSAYNYLRLEHRRLQMQHRATLYDLKQTRKQLNESVRQQSIVVPRLQRSRLDTLEQ